ncbi:MAG: phospholipid carrier-dependent glycosyltransferase [Anaerolineaceae bacterium]|nr:phospholipid carrier-dependent glycosyltransferase [Anaerolineaceae bacterium]
MAYVLYGTAYVPFHGDESTQIYMSRDYAYQFIDHDFGKLAYSPTPTAATEQELRLLNGTVNKYLIGLAWHANGMSISDVNEQWDWGADWNYNQQNGHAPNAPLLTVARWPSAILLAAGIIVMFALGRALGGSWTPYAASLYYALNPALLIDGRRAMMEGSFIFFSLLVLMVGVWLLEKPSLRRGILLGLVSGFALASKHTALFTVGAVYTGILLYLIYQSIRSEDDYSVVDYVLLPYLAIAAAITFGTFFALNPAWWGDPAQRAQTVLELRQNLLAGQTAAFGGYANFGEQLSGFLRQSFVVTPQYYEIASWQGYIGDQISQYDASVWRGVSIGGSVGGAVVLCGIMTGGIWSLIRPTTHKQDVGEPAGGIHWLIGLWALVTFITTLVLTPLEWQRYYLAVYPVIGLVAGLGVNWLIQNRNRLTLRRREPLADEIPLSGDDSRPDTLPEL